MLLRWQTWSVEAPHNWKLKSDCLVIGVSKRVYTVPFNCLVTQHYSLIKASRSIKRTVTRVAHVTECACVCVCARAPSQVIIATPRSLFSVPTNEINIQTSEK